MARSHKKTPICGNAGGSEKWDKRINNRMFRRREKVCIATEQWDRLPINMNEIRSTWSMNKDGKNWFGWMKYTNFIYRSRRGFFDYDDIDYYRKSYIKYMRK